MTTIETILDKYLTKVADFNSYSQILNLQKAIAVLQAALKSKDADPNVSKNIYSAIRSANTLASIAGKYGITAPLSARYRNEINSKIEQVESALTEINPYTDFAKVLNQSLPSIKSALNAYVPTNISAQEQATSPQTSVKAPERATFKFPEDVSSNWTLKPGEEASNVDPIGAVVSNPPSNPSGEAAKVQEPKVPFHMPGVKTPERVNPNIFPKTPEEVPAPGEPIGAKSSAKRIESLKKLANKVFF